MQCVRPDRETFARMCEEMTKEQIAIKVGVSIGAVKNWALMYQCSPRKVRLKKEPPSTAKYLPMPATGESINGYWPGGLRGWD